MTEYFGYRYGDTWYPTWASNDTLYSPWTDGATSKRLDGYNDLSHSGAGPYRNQTGQNIVENPPGSHIGMVFQKIELGEVQK